MSAVQNLLNSQAALPDKVIEARIVESKPIAQNQWSIWLKGEKSFPDFDPGNFCMLSLPDLTDPLTARPFAIVEKKDGMYQFIYRVTGKFTHLLATFPVGTRVGVLGPLGKGFFRESFKTGKHIFISGGVGFASLLPAIDQVKKSGGDLAGIFYGIRTDLEIIRKGNFDCFFSSDDGSIGEKGRLPALIQKNSALIQSADRFYICGPTAMMKAVFDLLPPKKSFYFLEETMGCGVGICIGCVVSVVGEDGVAKRVRSCLEGPIFRGDSLTSWKNN